MTAAGQVAIWRDWYEITEEKSLRQGDVFPRLLAFRFPQELPVSNADPDPASLSQIPLKWSRDDYIVISASCDIVRGEDTHVLLARMVEGSEKNLRVQSEADRLKKLEVVRQGYDPARFLLPECPDPAAPMPMSVVFYREQAFLPLQYMLANCVGPRLRLRPPFRERFGFWAAANLGRVGIEDESQIPQLAKFSAGGVLKAMSDS